MFQYSSILVGRKIVNPIIFKSRKSSNSLAKLKKIQADFQKEDGTMIWLRCGLPDKILYTSTIVGCWLGVIMCFSMIYDNAKPESWKEKKD